MENLQQASSWKQGNQLIQDNHKFEENMWLFDFHDPINSLNLYKKQNTENLKDCVYEPDSINANKTTSILDDKNKNISDIQKDISLILDKDVTVDNLMESVDLSDLTFSCNDFILGDCTCFEQASQLVDPTIKDSESTPFSFNNNDTVQLFKFSLPEGTEDSLLNKNLDNSDKFIDRSEGLQNDHYNFYQVFELFDNNLNVSKETADNDRKRKKEKKSHLMTSPIMKGRRYLPSFKQKVLEYTKDHTFKDTALHFKINCNTITEWSRESKRLSLQHKISIPGSDYSNYKTDIVGTPDSKTENILLNNEKPDERFIKWVEMKRLLKKQLSRQEVFLTAKCCLRKCPVTEDKPNWFVLWLKRFNKALKNSKKSNIKTEKYIKYPKNFKLEVALYARNFTKNSAARIFNVPRKRMFDWVNGLISVKEPEVMNKGSENIDDVERTDIAVGGKKGKSNGKIYMELYLWYQKMFLSGSRPTSNEIKEKGKEIFASHGVNKIKFSDGWLQKFCHKMNIKLRYSEDDFLLLWVLTQFDNNITLSHQDITKKSASLIGKKKFKGSKGWTLRFLKRHRNLLQLTPTVQDQLPQIVQEKLSWFWNTFRQSVSASEVAPANIGCMDEIPLSFNYPADGKSNSPPLLRKTGFECCQGVVILCCLGDGQIIPPAVVFKGTGPNQLLSERDVDILVMYQEKGLISLEVLEAWFNHVWSSCTSTPNALIVDSFQPHCAIKFRQLLDKKNCLLHVIPEGCSSRFQPLDVEITPLFKETMKNQWKKFSNNSNSDLANTSPRYRCPDQLTILRWVQHAFEIIKGNPVSIMNSFKTTGLLQ